MGPRTSASVVAALCWMIVAAVIIGIVMAVGVLPALMAGWRAQGIRSLPWTWQVVVDWSDFSLHRGFILGIPLLVGAIAATRSALKK